MNQTLLFIVKVIFASYNAIVKMEAKTTPEPQMDGLHGLVRWSSFSGHFNTRYERFVLRKGGLHRPMVLVSSDFPFGVSLYNARTKEINNE